MKKIICMLLLGTGFLNTNAQSPKLKTPESAFDFLVKALESGNRADLERITSDSLSYGHSSGKIENKTEFVEAFGSGKSDFITIDVSNKKIKVSGKNAIITHRLDAKTFDNGKAGEAHINIMLVLRKEKGGWKLLARQAVKIV
jgi:hypothetical protein